MSTVIDELVADAGLSDDESADLVAFLTDLERLGAADPPRPSAELAALLQAPPAPERKRPRLRLVAAAGAAAAMGTMTVTGVAAAANELPMPAQEFVADLSERLLPSPLHFPRPIPDREPAQQRVEKDQDEPGVIVEPPPAQPPYPIPDEGLPTTAPQRTGEMLTLDPTPTPTPTPPPPPAAEPSTTPAPSPTMAPSPTEPSASPTATGSAEPSESPAPSSSPDPTTTTEPSPSTDPRLGESPPPSDEEPAAGEQPSSTSGSDPTATKPKAAPKA